MIKQNLFKRILSLIIMISLFLSFNTITTFASSFNSLQQGTYDIKTSLSCYVTAMGGIEFGGPLLQSSKVTISSNGEASLTLYLTKSSTTIYGVTCDTFIDANPSYVTEDRGMANGTIGIYSQSGGLTTQGVTYTLSSYTAENSSKEQVNYVDSITLPLSYKNDSYNLALYVNSNVMGVQFCNSNSNAQLTTYPAILTVDWSSIPSRAENSNITSESSTSNTNTTGSSSANNNSSNASTSSSDSANNNSSTVTDDSTSVNNGPNGDNDTFDIVEVENMDGLSIYKVDNNENSSSDIKESPTYSANLNKPVIITIAVIAVIMIISGITLMALGNRRETNKNENEKANK